MALSQRSLETLIDLVEIKLSCLEVFDREDAREQANLEHCLNELQSLSGPVQPAGAPVLGLTKRGRGRPRAAH
ncbi:MAG: hypothetical protein MI920_15005 [Kiloniellales bacterium]|nr:hypothetical protein [Kiloniellales bacterium]